ncbi:MAG: hypothetical protein EOM25_12055, partial [Deltaproteobacteria bacterium]|nr:hypothetical protein [Deltaproteobacteria bacterium]
MTATGARIKDQSSGTLKRVVLATGGTGGHIFPALAVAERLVADCPGCSILFLGGERGPEGTLVRDSGIPGLSFEALPAAGVLGRGLKSLQALAWMTRSLRRCLGILTDFRPQVVLGLGGYAGFVPVLTACLKRIPTAIHEQNSVPGVTNRVLARRVDRVLVSFADMEGPVFGGPKAVVTGNPVRAEIRAGIILWQQPVASDAEARRIVTEASRLRGMA